MKLEVGMYVRTKWGYICELVNINDFREPSMKYGVEASYLKDIMFIGDEDISKASHNIIDLIEIGDYVNGKLINEIDENRKLLYSYERDDYYIFRDYDVKSIVTSQQFESMQYKVD